MHGSAEKRPSTQIDQASRPATRPTTIAVCNLGTYARSARKRAFCAPCSQNMPTARRVASFAEPLDHGIGVRIPASQPLFSFVAFDEQVERLNVSN